MARRTTPIPRRRAFPDITDDFALDELIYDQEDVDPPNPEGTTPDQEHHPDTWQPQDPNGDNPPPSPLDYPEP
ncbi:MAG: hypothetical protein ACYC9Q_01160 [Bacillota bacterium]